MAEKRRILLFAVMAAVSLVVFSEAFPTTAFTKLGLKGSHEALSSLFHAARELDMSGNLRGSCADDIAMLSSQKFASCMTVFERASNLGRFSNDTLEAYCAQDCSDFVWNLLSALATDCGNTPPDTSVREYVLQSCKRGPGNVYCIEDWNAIVSPGATSTPIYMQYRNCTEQFPTSIICPTSCKAFLKWVTDTLGCCARSPIDYNETGSGALNSLYWDRCGYKEPVQCT